MLRLFTPPQEMHHTTATPALPWRRKLCVFAAQALVVAQTTAPVYAADMTDNRFLDMDLVQLMEVTVTSVSKKPQTLADTAAAVYVITQEDIRRSGVTSVPEALAMAPGIQVARISASKWSIASRGFAGYTSNKLLVLIDGRSVYSPAYSGVFWDMQNTMLEDIDRIEVIRGPGGTIWGANAVNGVINIITKKAKETLGTLVRAGVGTEEKWMAAARQGSKIGDSAFARVYVTGNNRDSNELAGSDRDAHDGWQALQTGFRADGTVGANNEWTVQGDVFRNNGDQISFPYWLANSPFPTTKFGDFSSNGGNLLGNWHHHFADGDRLSLKAYYDQNSRNESYYDMSFHTLDFDLQYETTLGDRNDLTMGVGYRQVDSQFEDTFQVHIPDQTNDLYSAFFQDEIKLIKDRVWLTLGAKYEHNDFTGNEWQPSARVLWKPEVDHSIWAAIARAVRTPSLVENGGALTMAMMPTPSPGVFAPIKLYGNPNFDVETLLAYEIGYRWQARRNLSFDLAGYYNDYNDIYSTIPSMSPGSRDLIFENAREGYGYGLEFAANWQAKSWWNLALTYAYMRFELENKAEFVNRAPDDTGSSQNNPRHQASIRSSVDFAQNWQFNTWLRYVDEIKARNSLDLANPLTVGSYLNLDANLIWKPKKDLEVMFAARNLFNSNQLEYVAELITPPTEIDRSFFVKVTWSF